MKKINYNRMIVYNYGNIQLKGSYNGEGRPPGPNCDKYNTPHLVIVLNVILVILVTRLVIDNMRGNGK